MPTIATCPAVSTVIGGCIAAGVGFGLAWWRRWRDGRDRFHAVIGELQAKLDGFGNMDNRTAQFHRDSTPELVAAIFAVQPFVSKASFKRLRELLRKYKDDDFDWKATLDARTACQLVHGNETPGVPPWAADKLRDYMEKFRAEVG